MSAEITPEQVARLRKMVEVGGRSNAWRKSDYLAILDALESSRAKARRSDAGRVEVPEIPFPEYQRRISSPELLTAWFRENARLSPSPQPATGADITDAELDAIYPESHNLGTHYQEIHRARLRKVIAVAMAHTSADVVVPREEWEILNAFLDDWRAPESRSLHDWNTSLKAKAARINALRSSTNHDAQDAGEGR